MLEYILIKLPTYLQIGQAPPKISKQFLQDDKCPHFLFKYCADLFKQILHSLIDYYSACFFLYFYNYFLSYFT